MPHLPKISVHGRLRGCCHPPQQTQVCAQLSFTGQEGCDHTNPFIWAAASCLDKNKKGTLIRQMRCFKTLLGTQNVLAVAEKHFFSALYICLRFSLQYALLKICLVVGLGRIKLTIKRSSLPAVLRELKLKLVTCLNYIYLI